MVLIPAFLMVSTIRFRSVKAIDMGWRRGYLTLFLAAVALALIASHPRWALVILAYSYVMAAVIVWAVRLGKRQTVEAPTGGTPPSEGLWLTSEESERKTLD